MTQAASVANIPRSSGPNEPSEDAPKAKKNWLGWGLAIFILLGCFFFLDLEVIKTALARISGFDMVLILAICTADRLLMGFKWSLLLRIVDAGLPHWQAVKLFYQGSLSGVFMPSHVGGDILRAHWASKANGKAHETYASIVMERMLGLISAVNWAIAGGLFCVLWLQPAASWLWGGLALIGFVSANGIFLLSLHERVHVVILRFLAGSGKKRGKIAGILHRFYEAYSRFSQNRRALLINFGLTVIEHGLQMLTFFVIAMAIGVEIGLVLFIAASAIQMLLYRIPVAPDGWGVGELTAIAVYSVIGIAAEKAFMISFLGHIFVLVALLPGLYFLLRGHKLPDSREMARIEQERQKVAEVMQAELDAVQNGSSTEDASGHQRSAQSDSHHSSVNQASDMSRA